MVTYHFDTFLFIVLEIMSPTLFSEAKELNPKCMKYCIWYETCMKYCRIHGKQIIPDVD